MLSVKDNLRETMKKDGHPDRFVNGFEYLNVMPECTYYMGDYPVIPTGEDQSGYDMYGVFWSLPVGQMGAYPVHDAEHTLLQVCISDKGEYSSPVSRSQKGSSERMVLFSFSARKASVFSGLRAFFNSFQQLIFPWKNK